MTSLSAITTTTALDFTNLHYVATTGAIAGNQIFLIDQGAPVDSIPSHVPEAKRDFVSRTLIMTAPLD